MIKTSRRVKKAMTMAMATAMLASTVATPVMAAQGWFQDAHGYWYTNEDGSYLKNQWLKDANGKWYYFDEAGYMVTDWEKIGGQWYYFAIDPKDGSMQSGWFQDGSKNWYYADPTGGNEGAVYANKWAAKDGNWYYFDANSYMAKGWFTDCYNNTCFADATGAMQTGFVKVNGDIYYLDPVSGAKNTASELTVGEVKYTFDATGKLTGENVPNVDNVYDADGEVTLTVTAVTSPMSNEDGDIVMTVLFNSAVDAERLEDTTITLKGVDTGVTATAVFDSINGAEAVYMVSNPKNLLPGDSSADDTYTVSADGFAVDADVKLSYEETLTGNMIQGIVYEINHSGAYVPVANAKVMVDDKEVMTDINGYYSIKSLSGMATVEVDAPGRIASIDENLVEVSRNYVSVRNIRVQNYNQEDLYIVGNVLDQKTNDTVDVVRVDLKEKATGNVVATVYTTDGEFTFGNSKTALSVNASLIEMDGTFKFGLHDANKISADKEYQVEVSRAYNDTVLNAAGTSDDVLYSAYHTKAVDVKVNRMDEETRVKNIRITPVEEVEDATLKLSWAKDAVQPVDNHKIYASLMDVNGKVLLNKNAGEITVAMNDNVKLDNNAMEEPFDLVGEAVFADMPTLPSGTYYLVVGQEDDQTKAVNAITVIPVVVKEGSEFAAEGTITAAQTINLTTKVKEIDKIIATQLANSPDDPAFAVKVDKNGTTDDSTDTLSVTYTLSQKVGNVNVVIGELPPMNFTYDAIGSIVIARGTIENLCANATYVAATASDYMKMDTVNFTAKANKVVNVDNTVTGAANINKIDLTEAFTKEKDAGTLDLAGAIIEYVIIKDASGKEVRNVSGINNDNFNTTTEVVEVNNFVLDGIPAGKYTATIKIRGFAEFTTSKFELYELHDATVYADKRIVAEVPSQLSGYVQFEDGTYVSDSGAMYSIMLINAVGEVKYAGIFNTETYTISGMLPGTYTMIVRGQNAQTVTRTVTIKANEVVYENLELEKILGAKIKTKIYDETGKLYEEIGGLATDVKLTDAYYVDPFDPKWVNSSPVVVDNTGNSLDIADFSDNDWAIGKYDMNFENADKEVNTTMPEDAIDSKDEYLLPAGKYSMFIPETSDTWKKTVSINVRASHTTETKIITLDNKTTGRTIDINLTVANLLDLTGGNAADNDTIAKDWILVKDSNGEVVAKLAVEDSDDNSTDDNMYVGKVSVADNGTYTIEVYAAERFVASKVVKVQGFDKDVTIVLDDAERE